jgi:hypothetical protein
MSASIDLLGTDWIVPTWSIPVPGIHAISTTRNGGASTGVYAALDGSGGLNLGQNVGDLPNAVALNRTMLNQYVPAPVQFLSQVHGAVVLNAANLSAMSDMSDADAMVANQPHMVCAVQTADCLPVLFCDIKGRVVGAAHAGWRGLAAGVLEATVQQMRKQGADEILAWLGPAIGAQQFEVGSDVLQAFSLKLDTAAQFFTEKSTSGKYLADIYGLACTILQRSGVDGITGGEHCTVSDTKRFYSYRRDRITGRMASLIWID